MKKTSRNFCRWLVLHEILGLLAASNLSAPAQTDFTAAMPPDYLKTNGEWVTIGGIMVKTNSSLDTIYFKQFKWRNDQLLKINNSGVANATDLVVEGAWALIKDYPKEANGYQDIMMAVEDYEYLGQSAKARAQADKLMGSAAPEEFKQWAEGFLYRTDHLGKPIEMKFVALDGRAVDLAKMRGKVVLVVFWEMGFERELARVAAAFGKFHAQGFEVIGIYGYTNKREFKEYIQQQHISWPWYFDDERRADVGDKISVQFGIDGVPSMFLVDKQGCLHFDNVRAVGDTASFEDKISRLLAE